MFVVEEDHEVGEGVAVLAAGADAAHEIHAHGVAAEGEEGGVAEAEDAGEAPDKVDCEGEDGVGEVFAGEGYGVGGDVDGAGGGGGEVEGGEEDGAADDEGEG